MGAVFHVIDAFGKSCVAQADRRIAVVEQLVDGFSGLQTCNGAVLPLDGSHIGKGSEQPFVTNPERAMAQFQAFVHQVPEFFFVATGRAGNVYEVESYYRKIFMFP